jgi:divalent metal cation (Fe/Co/Zn/Cd) transporter
MSVDAARAADVRAGIRVELFSLVWMVVEAAVSIGAGVLAHSVLLTAFGIDSVIEFATGAIVLWRLLVEARGADVERVERAEHRASWVTGIALALLSVYVFVTAGIDLATGRAPESSVVGVVMAVAALIVMPWLAYTKRRIAARLDSASLRGDATSSLTCGYMAGTVLLGLGLHATLHVGWVEDVAALAFLYWLVRETRETLEEARETV